MKQCGGGRFVKRDIPTAKTSVEVDEGGDPLSRSTGKGIRQDIIPSSYMPDLEIVWLKEESPTKHPLILVLHIVDKNQGVVIRENLDRMRMTL